jgi:hypothetical protein
MGKLGSVGGSGVSDDENSALDEVVVDEPVVDVPWLSESESL